MKIYDICETYDTYDNSGSSVKFIKKKQNYIMVKRKDKKGGKLITVKDIINKYNVSYQIVNHYTDFGLLPISLREGNVRFYDRNIVGKRLKKIRALMNEGYSLRLIRRRLVGI
jgi:hypothetical protein